MVKLPHELSEPENAHLVPLSSKGDRLRSFRLSYDPELDKDKKGGKSAVKMDLSSNVRDPRDKNARRKGRRELRVLTFKWDQHSTRPKPPPPPHSIVISGLSPLVTVPQIRQHMRPFGRTTSVELKLDPSTGGSTGVCYVSFVHDYDESLKLLPDVVQGKAQRGDLVAKVAREKCDGQRLGADVVAVCFDDADGTVYRKTYRDLLGKKMEAMQAAKQREALQHTVKKPVRSSPPAAVSMRPPGPPKAPKSMMNTGKASVVEREHDASPSRSPYTRIRSSSSSRDEVSRTGVRSFASTSRRFEEEQRYSHEGQDEKRTAGRTVVSERSPNTRRDRFDESESKEDDELRTTLEQLIRNDRPYAFVPRIRASNINTEAITAAFAQHRPEWIKRCDVGWFIAFRGKDDAQRSRNVVHGTTISGYRITVEVDRPSDAERALSRRREGEQERRGTETKQAIDVEKKHWTESELVRDSKLLLLYELGHAFMRDMRSRVLSRLVTDFLQPDGPGGKLLREVPPKATELDELDLEIDLEAERPKTFNRAAREEQRQRKLALQREAERREREAALGLDKSSDEEDEGETELVMPKREVQSGKRKSGKQPKAARQDNDVSIAALKEGKLTKAAKKAPRAPSPPLDPFKSGLAEEEEDLYFCRRVLERWQNGEGLVDMLHDKGDAEAAPSEDVDFPSHSSGCARTQGFYRIPPAEKGRHLADRNLGSDDVVVAPSAVGLASARDNRADSRRFVQGIEQHKKETATDTDILKFNQLRSRKKQLKFAKSPIHDWGLYAMETIPAGDMVIEYVGEIVRQQVADEREKMYERQGNFSTYLFRVDDDIVVDATKKGNIARLMNHCCTPNCNAKILTLNGEKRIVLYAKQTILPGQELTYDYKFQATGDEEDAIACLCGSPGCRGFL